MEFLDTGELRISTPQARGAAQTAKGPDQLWHRLAYLRTEAAIAAYAMWRGVRYDLDELTDPTDPTEPPRRRPYTPREREGDHSEVSYSRRATVRPDQAHPQEWTPNPDGSWTSPKGKVHKHPARVKTIVINRSRMGLSTTYEQWLAEQGEESA